MRIKFGVLVLLVILGVAITATVTGQEEPLPVLPVYAPADTSAAYAPEIVLAVYPIREAQQPTLADAARRNDYVTFHALYEETQPAEYRTLHELWTWAIQDPIGAFYGREIYDRLSAAYPDYAAWIEPYRIVDSRGNVFYPTSETRTFLLQRALDREAPPVMIAETTTAETLPAATSRESAEERRTVTPSTTGTRRRIASSAPVTVKTPVQTTVEPVVPAIVETAPAPATTAAVPPPATLAPKIAVPAPAAPVPARSSINGILLLAIGILGVLLLAVILRTQRTAKVVL